MIEEAIFKILKDDAAVAAIVGDKIVPQRAAQQTDLPYVVYELISSQHMKDMDGASGLANPLFRLTSWETTYAKVKALAEAVRLALVGFRGTIDGNVIQGIFLENQLDGFDLRPDGSEGNADRVIQEWSIWYCEPVPP